MTLLLWFLQEEAGSGGGTAKDIVTASGLHLGARDYLLLTLIVSAITTIVSVVSKVWIEESIKDRFKKEMEDHKLILLKDLEEYKREITRRDQAARVAELLALVKSGTREDVIKANQLSWEMSLWLPPEVAKTLAKVLAKAPDAPNHTKLLIEIRCILLGLSQPDITELDIATFPA
jgi:hypothetical protein